MVHSWYQNGVFESACVCESRSYYESSDLPSAISVMEEALSRHPELVTPESVNMAAELYIANHQYSKALEVRTCLEIAAYTCH